MSVFIFTLDRQAMVTRGVKPGQVSSISELGGLKTHRPEPGDMTYLDVSGLKEAESRKMLSLLKKRCLQRAWGIVDPDGSIADPASLFFSGASDYVGPGVNSGVPGKARVKAALGYFEVIQRSTAVDSTMLGAGAPKPVGESPEPGFGGWNTIRPGSVYPFYFLLVSVSAQMNLRTRLGESGYRTFRDRLRQQLHLALADSEPLLWMETEAHALYLVPPCASRALAATEACLRMLLGAPLIGYERLGLPFPIAFSFSMHYGETEFAPPGKTGTIVSDAVNFIYHMGTKRTEMGRLTVSEEALAFGAHHGLKDLFVPAGILEGRAIAHTRRFV
ncbi:MAG: hypothetical protein RBT62_05945 [Spirochaetia bacterium]|jgi:hypothetical protein|nr:hypothetical protein [Spirochaetia bacterium]